MLRRVLCGSGRCAAQMTGLATGSHGTAVRLPGAVEDCHARQVASAGGFKPRPRRVGERKAKFVRSPEPLLEAFWHWIGFYNRSMCPRRSVLRAVASAAVASAHDFSGCWTAPRCRGDSGTSATSRKPSLWTIKKGGKSETRQLEPGEDVQR